MVKKVRGQDMTLNQVWDAVDQGLTIYWGNRAYAVYVEKADGEYQKNHFTNRNGKVLGIRYIETYWGGLMCPEEMSELFLEV